MFNTIKITRSLVKTATSLYKILPLILGMILLLSLLSQIIPRFFYGAIFQDNAFFDSIIGSVLGSISTGPPITSYILGGEFLNAGVSLIAVTAFMVAWVTVGILQFPAESIMLGAKFAVVRNMTSFIFSVVVAIITVFLFRVL